MAKTSVGSLSDGNGRWFYANFMVIILKFLVCNILRVLFNVAAYATHTISLFFQSVSDKFKTVETVKDLVELHIKTCRLTLHHSCETIDHESLSLCSQEIAGQEDVFTEMFTSQLLTEAVDQSTSSHKVVYQEISTKAFQFYEETKDQKLYVGEVDEEGYGQESHSVTSEEDFEQNITNNESKSPKIENTSLGLIIKTIKQNEIDQNLEYKAKMKMDGERINGRKYQKTNMNNYCGYKKLVGNKKSINIINESIFNLPPEFSLAHCVTKDLCMSRNISLDFKLKFGQIAYLFDQNLYVGDCGEIINDNGQYVFYLVIKRYCGIKPLLIDLRTALIKLRDKMIRYNLTKLAIPKSGLDTYYLTDAKKYISKVFTGFDIDISLSTFSVKSNLCLTLPEINLTSENLWEMQPLTDLIMFVDMEKVYLDSWKDIVVDMVDARYPFKNRFLKDIKIKPLDSGHVFIYNVGCNVLFCILVKTSNTNRLHFRDMEIAFKEIKSQMTGYRYLGIQREKLYSPILFRYMCCYLSMLQNVFSRTSVEIWICGHTDDHRMFPRELFNKFVHSNVDKKGRTNKKIRTRLGK